jgi:predicted RNA binding protein YcfA (HicA-like mRNA interferase family)
MKSVSGKDFARILEKHGWSLVRVTGSHHIYKKASHRESISVPIHGNKSLKGGLLRFFLKSAGLDEKDLE